MLAVDCIWKKNYLLDGNHSVNISSQHCGTSSSFIVYFLADMNHLYRLYAQLRCTGKQREQIRWVFAQFFLNHSALFELRVHISQFHEFKTVGNIFIVEILLKSQCCPHGVSRWGMYTQEHLFLLFFTVSHCFNSEVY